MSTPLDQRQLTASLEDFERYLARFQTLDPVLDPKPPSIDVSPSAPEAPSAASEPVIDHELLPPVQAHGAEPSTELFETLFDESYVDDEDEEPKPRHLLLALAGLIMAVGVGAGFMTLTYWGEPAAENAALESPVKEAATPLESDVAAPAEQSQANAGQSRANVVEAPAKPQTPAAASYATEPKKVKAVAILPDGSLAPDNGGVQVTAPPATPAPAASQRSEQPIPTPPLKSDARGQHAPTAKAAKPPTTTHGAKQASAKARPPSTEERPVEPAAPAPPPQPSSDSDGIFQSAERAVGSLTGAVKKLVGGN